MWIVLQIQPRWPPLDPAQQKVLDGIERDRSYPQSIIDGLRYLRERERFRQPKNLYELALALLAQARFHQTVHLRETLRQNPMSKRRSLGKRIRLLLQQRQVMQWIAYHVFAFIAPRVACDHLARRADHHFMHEPFHQHFAVPPTHRHPGD